MSRYAQIISGRWEPLPKEWDLACCDCHLVHGVTIRVHNGVPQIRMTVDGRATGQLRRHHRINIKRKHRGKAKNTR